MDYVERKFKIFQKFFMLLRFYQFNYGEDKEKNKSEKDSFLDYEGSFQTLKIENSLFIDELEIEKNKKENEYKQLAEQLSNIKYTLLKSTHEKMLEKLRNAAVEYGQDSFEYLNMKTNVESSALSMSYYEKIKNDYDKLKGEIIKIDDMLKFHKILILFSVLIYTSILYKNKDLKKESFIKINSEFDFNNSVALLNLMFLLEEFYYGANLKDIGYEFMDEFVSNILNLDYFLTILVISNDSLKFPYNKFIDYYSGCIIRDRTEKKQERDELRCNFNEFLNLIILQQFILYILNKLNVRFDGSHERKVAHYTRLDVGFSLVTKSSKMRLNSTDFMNDPSEGEILSQFFNLKKIESENPHSHIFLSCFTFNHNSLNQFRLYGNTSDVECSGMSIVYSSDFFEDTFSTLLDFNVKGIGYSKLPLFRCIYLDSFSGFFEVAKRNKFTFYQEYKNKKIATKMWGIYEEKIKKIEISINFAFERMKNILKDLEKTENLKIIIMINNILRPLNFLIKHFSFQEEQECRMMKIEEISDNSVIYDSLYNKSYIEYQVDCDEKIKNIYLGEKAKSNHTYLIKRIIESGCKLPTIRVSDNPFRSFKENVILDK